MWWAFSTLLTTVHVDDDITIDWQPLVWVDTDAEKTGVCLNERGQTENLRSIYTNQILVVKVKFQLNQTT